MTGQNSNKTNRNFTDILIVGAGPAGISAAKTAREAGASVLLIDRAQRPGTKACAGGLTREAMAELALDRRTDLPANRFNKLKVVTRTGSVVLDSDDGGPLIMTVDRPALQLTELEMLRELGVDVACGERLIDVQQGIARTDKRMIPFGRLIGADGVHSRVRRRMGLTKRLRVCGLQLRVSMTHAALKGIDPSLPTVWFDTDLLGSGYAWSFPFNGELRLGVGIARPGPPEGLRCMFETWLKRIGLSSPAGPVASGTIGCDYQGYRFGNVLLAGDAAGLASPLTGEGIAQALISGREVAREVVEPGYRSDRIATLAARHRRTMETLFDKRLSRILDAAPFLLRIGLVRREAIHRFVY
jgi:geranylgeranyl reductase family protein